MVSAPGTMYSLNSDFSLPYTGSRYYKSYCWKMWYKSIMITFAYNFSVFLEWFVPQKAIEIPSDVLHTQHQDPGDTFGMMNKSFQSAEQQPCNLFAKSCYWII